MSTLADPRERQHARPRYARLALLGMALLSAAILLVAIPALLQIPDAWGLALTLLAISAVGTAVTWRFDALWARIVALVACVALAMMMFWIVFGLASPASPVEFVAAVLFVLGLVLGVGGNVAAIGQARRGILDMRPTPFEERATRAAVGIVGLAAVFSVAMFFTSGESVDATVAADAVDVRMSGFEFEPEQIEVADGGHLLVRNSDACMPDITVPDLGIDPVAVGPGKEVLIPIDADTGSYTAMCTFHANVDDPDPEADMMATLVVR